MTQSLTESFRLIALDRLLYGIEVAGEPHLVAVLAGKIAGLSGLPPHAIYKGFADGVRLGPDVRSGGVLVTSVALPGYEETVWTAARLSSPLRLPGRRPVDLAFAVAGGVHSLAARRALQSFYRLSADATAMSHIRKANSASWFRAELAIAFERLAYRENDRMTG